MVAFAKCFLLNRFAIEEFLEVLDLLLAEVQ